MIPNAYKGIINGDSDKILDELFNCGVRYELILTDPPYNVGKDFGNNSDKLPLSEFLELVKIRVKKLKQLLSHLG